MTNRSPKLSAQIKESIERTNAQTIVVKSASNSELLDMALKGGPIGKLAQSELVMHRGYDFDEVDSYVNG